MSTVLTPNNAQYNTDGPWSANASAWNEGSLVYGVGYTQSITLNNQTFPDGTLISWSWPMIAAGVRSYPGITYGSSPELINPTVQSTQVANFANLSTSYSINISGDTGGFDTIFDMWLTSRPNGDPTTQKYEIEIVAHADWTPPASNLAYTLSDSTLQNAAVYVMPGYSDSGVTWTNITIMPQSDILAGTISISDILKSLIWNGEITGHEYLSGVEFGPEVSWGSGSLLISNLSYQWNGNPTITFAEGDNTYSVATPGGNDVVENGGVDTVVYNGLYSEFQIKSSGSETLVTENNNISTLDYLEGVTYIKFSDGTYDTVTSTFTPASQDIGPVETVSNLTATHGESFAASALYNYSAPNGATINEYWVTASNPSVGQWYENGQPVSGAITPAQLSELTFDALGPGSETIYLQATDNGGLTWSTWRGNGVTVTVTEPPPPVQAPIELTVSMTAGEVLSGSSLFNAASVPNGATINEYWVTASNPSVGQWYENGQPVSGAITPAQLSELTFDALGPGSETIYLQATDNGGLTWSTWRGNGVTVTVTEPPPPVQAPIELTVSMTAGEVLSGSSLFNAASVPNGATINEYWVTAGNPSVGQWDLNGQPVSGAVTPAQLSELTFDALGPGSETIYLQATDNGGATWSAWQGNGVAVTVAQSPPVVETPIQSAVSMTAGEVLSGSSLFNAASAPNGATITEYWVTASNPSLGQWYENGQPVSGAITPAQLSGLTFDALGPGSETIYLQATDDGGLTWSAWQGNGVTMTVPTPTLSVTSDNSATAGQVINLSSLAIISDPGNVGYQELELWDSDGTVAGGQFVVNGVAQTGGHEIDVSPANVANTVFDAGTLGGTDTLAARLLQDNGTLTAWQEFTVKDPLTIADGATVELSSAYAGPVMFAGSTGTLQLDNSSSFSGTVAGMTGQDTIDFADINFTKVQTPSYSGNSSGGTLTVTDGTHSANIALLGNYLASSFVTSSDGHGGTNIVDPVLSSVNQQLALTQPQHA